MSAARFPGSQVTGDSQVTFPVERTEVLQYGDDPEVEPGQVLARVVLATPADEEERARAFEAVHDEHRRTFHELRRELNKLAVPVMLQFVAGEHEPDQTRQRILKDVAAKTTAPNHTGTACWPPLRPVAH